MWQDRNIRGEKEFGRKTSAPTKSILKLERRFLVAEFKKMGLE